MLNGKSQPCLSFLSREARWWRGRDGTSEDHLDFNHRLSWIWLFSHPDTKALSPKMSYFTSRPDSGSPWADLLGTEKINHTASHSLPPSENVSGLWGDVAVDDLAGLSIFWRRPFCLKGNILKSFIFSFYFRPPWISFNLEIRKHLGCFFFMFV